MEYVYILQMIIETDDEIKMEIDSVYTTREKAATIGKNLVASKDEYIGHYISRHMIFQWFALLNANFKGVNMTNKREKPLVTGEDAKRFMDKVKRNQEHINSLRELHKQLLEETGYNKDENN